MSSTVVDEKERTGSLKDDLPASETTLETPQEAYIVPPDGGRGWLVVLGSFMVKAKRRKVFRWKTDI